VISRWPLTTIAPVEPVVLSVLESLGDTLTPRPEKESLEAQGLRRAHGHSPRSTRSWKINISSAPGPRLNT
jgi:hypothetical protein